MGPTTTTRAKRVAVAKMVKMVTIVVPINAMMSQPYPLMTLPLMKNNHPSVMVGMGIIRKVRVGIVVIMVGVVAVVVFQVGFPSLANQPPKLPNSVPLAHQPHHLKNPKRMMMMMTMMRGVVVHVGDQRGRGLIGVNWTNSRPPPPSLKIPNPLPIHPPTPIHSMTMVMILIITIITIAKMMGLGLGNKKGVHLGLIWSVILPICSQIWNISIHIHHSRHPRWRQRHMPMTGSVISMGMGNSVVIPRITAPAAATASITSPHPSIIN